MNEVKLQAYVGEIKGKERIKLLVNDFMAGIRTLFGNKNPWQWH